MVWTTSYVQTESYDAPPNQLVAGNVATFVEHNQELNIDSKPDLVRQTGIVCTLGPSSRDVDTIEKMMMEGGNIMRLNMALGERDTYEEYIENIHTAAERYSKRLGIYFPVAIAIDIKGAEIRTGEFDTATGEVELVKGDQVKLTTDAAYRQKGNSSIFYVDYANIHQVVHVGHRIYVDNGLISLFCTKVQGCVITCTIEHGGVLGGLKTVNLPGTEIDLPAISEKDILDLEWAASHDVDIVFAAYVREVSGIKEVRKILGPEGSKIKVIADIENQQGVYHFDEIIKAADGIMIGRGDLGIEVPVEKLFLVQKSIIAKCNLAGKPVIVGNGILATMIQKARPSRAECADVANAVIDGVDCLMLTNETVQGDCPIESTQMLSKICREAEAAIWHQQLFAELISTVLPPLEPTHGICIATVEASHKCLAAAIIVLSSSGKSAFLLSRYRPKCPIITVVRDKKLANQCHLYKGILPLYYTGPVLPVYEEDIEMRVNFAIHFGKWQGIIKDGDPIITTFGSRKGSGYTDTMKISYVTKPVPDGCGCEEMGIIFKT